MGAVVQAIAIIGPGVAMSVELEQGDWPQLLGVGLDQRVGDEVVAAEGQHTDAARQDMIGMRFDRTRHGLGMMGIDEAIAEVDHREMFERIEAEREGLELGELYRSRTDCARAEATAWPVR